MTVIARLGRLIAVALLASCLLPAASRAADDAGKITAAVDGAFRPLLTKYDIPGIAVAVTVDGREYFFNYGLASKADNKPVTKDTLFELGSVSKTFTATLAGYAQALGKLSLDDHPGKYMPALRGSAIDKASLINLGTFTAGGLPLQLPGSVTTNAATVSYLKHWQPSAAPGAQRRYSNPSIGLFGYVTALAMHGDFAGLVESEIFPGLGLGHSYINVPKAAMANYAWGYSKDNKPIRVGPAVFDVEAYGVKSTTADMIHYVEANIRPDNLAMPMRRAIEGTHVGYFRTGEMVQGLGWEQYAYPVTLDRLLEGNSDAMIMKAQPATALTPPLAPSRLALFNKTGSTNGFGSYVVFVPDKRIGIVMMANRNFPIPARVTASYAVLEQLTPGSR